MGIPIIGFMCVHNGADFIEYAIRSTIKYVERFVVIEGAWQTGIMVNGEPRSTDGTLEILEELQTEFHNLQVYQHNDKEQLEQRNRIFEYIEPCWLWLIDHDEVYKPEDAGRVQDYCAMFAGRPIDIIRINSFTFINNFTDYVPIAFPRLFQLRLSPVKDYYKFIAPNHISLCNRQEIDLQKEIMFFHYSYCHSPKRFMQKRRERLKVHGQFKWLHDGEKVTAPGIKIRKFEGKHPTLMERHPRWENI
jgi:glycosyltransferase involved in cell wall biosynthesis